MFAFTSWYTDIPKLGYSAYSSWFVPCLHVQCSKRFIKVLKSAIMVGCWLQTQFLLLASSNICWLYPYWTFKTVLHSLLGQQGGATGFCHGTIKHIQSMFPLYYPHEWSTTLIWLVLQLQSCILLKFQINRQAVWTFEDDFPNAHSHLSCFYALISRSYGIHRSGYGANPMKLTFIAAYQSYHDYCAWKLYPQKNHIPWYTRPSLADSSSNSPIRLFE